MLALWILLGLCAFIALLLLLPLHIYLAFTPEAGFSFYARYTFLTIRPDSEPNEKLMEQVFTLLGLRDVSQHGQRAQRRLGQGCCRHAV